MAASSVTGATAPVEAPTYLDGVSQWARAAYARFRAAVAMVSRGFYRSAPSKAASGPAPITSLRLKRSGPRTTEAAFLAMVERRAIRKCNRSRKAAAQYLNTNLALRRAAYSEVPE